MQIKTAMRYHFTTVKSATVKKKSLLVTNFGGDVGKMEPWYTVGGTVNWFRHHGKHY